RPEPDPGSARQHWRAAARPGHGSGEVRVQRLPPVFPGRDAARSDALPTRGPRAEPAARRSRLGAPALACCGASGTHLLMRNSLSSPAMILKLVLSSSLDGESKYFS